MRKRQAQVHIYIDINILEKMRKMANEEGRTVTELIREGISELIRDRERQTPKKKKSF